MRLFGWGKPKQVTFTQCQVDDLVCRIKDFNAGAIDNALTNYIDGIYTDWWYENTGVYDDEDPCP